VCAVDDRSTRLSLLAFLNLVEKTHCIPLEKKNARRGKRGRLRAAIARGDTLRAFKCIVRAYHGYKTSLRTTPRLSTLFVVEQLSPHDLHFVGSINR